MPVWLRLTLAAGATVWLVLLRDTGKPPPPAPSKAELLVGCWKQVTRDAERVAELFDLTMTFSADGKLVIQMHDSRHGPQPPRTGTYRLEADTIWLTTEADAEEPGRTWSVTIDRLTSEELHLSKDGHRSTFVRDNGTRRPATPVRRRPQPPGDSA